MKSTNLGDVLNFKPEKKERKKTKANKHRLFFPLNEHTATAFNAKSRSPKPSRVPLGDCCLNCQSSHLFFCPPCFFSFSVSNVLR